MAEYQKALLPCTFERFAVEIVPDRSFIRLPCVVDVPVCDVILRSIGQNFPVRAFTTMDSSMIVYCYETMCLVYTATPKEKESWIIKATLMNVEDYLCGQSAGFFAPTYILKAYTEGKKSELVELLGVYKSTGDLIFKGFDTYNDNYYYQSSLGQISYEAFTGLQKEYLGDIETSKFDELKVVIYPEDISYAETCNIAALEIKNLILRALASCSVESPCTVYS